MITLRVYLAFLALSLVVSCQSIRSNASKSTQEAQSATSPQVLTDDALMSLVRKFNAGLENEQPVLQEISRYPRSETIERLRKLQQTLPENSSDTIAIAFMLCHLDYESASNKAIIVKAFTRLPHNQDPYADWEAELIRRLIDKGHRDLVPALLAASEWSDGALSESLSGFYAEQVRTAPQDFLSHLSTQPKNVRQAVYALAARELDDNDVDKLKAYLNSTSDPKVKSVGQEMLPAVRAGRLKSAGPANLVELVV